MGSSESKPDLKHELLFNDDEKKQLSDVFCTISHGAKTFDKDQFQHFTHALLDPFTSSRLFDLLEGPVPHHHRHRIHLPHHHHHQSGAGNVNLHHFASHLGVLLKGELSDLARTCIFIASTSTDSVSAEDLVKLVTLVLVNYEKLLNAHCTAYQSWMFAQAKDSQECLAFSLLKDLLKSDEEKSDEGHTQYDHSLSFKEPDVEDWLTKCSFFTHILQQVIQGAFQFYPMEHRLTRVPQVRDTNWSQCSTILDFPTALYLSHALPANLKSPWKMIFSSRVHGASFSQLLQSIVGRGPTCIIIKEKAGNVFGGFAAQSWEVNAKFTGSSGCFLFQGRPNFGVYTPTGYNTNYLYLNHHVKTLPNGLGMGGQFEYFGLWIDQSFNTGHSKAGSRGNTTYGSPQLSQSPDFDVDCIEVWALGRQRKTNGDDDEEEEEDEEDSSNSAGAGRSILDKVEDEDKHLLDLMDRGTISDAIRAEPIVEETQAHRTIISPF